MTASSGSPVLLRTEGRAAHLTLNRPAALNALTHAMVRTIADALDTWESDPGIETVVVTGAGERGLCAGGDIRAIHRDAATGGTASADFWRDEYRLNARVARLRKPYVAVMDGIVMGGGVGISAHGTVRLVTERSRIAMPETGIGFVPDVGGTHLLGLAPGELGTHLALTGAPVGAADAQLCGLADHFVPSEAIPALLAGLATAPVHDVLTRHVRPAPPAGSTATAAGSTTATRRTRSRRSSTGCWGTGPRRRRTRPRRCCPDRPRRSRSPWPRSAAPVGSGLWKGCWSSSSGSPAPPSAIPTWWRASVPR